MSRHVPDRPALPGPPPGRIAVLGVAVVSALGSLPRGGLLPVLLLYVLFGAVLASFVVRGRRGGRGHELRLRRPR